MNVETFAVEAAVQRTHWWFVGRRRLLERLMVTLEPKPAWRVLDVGVGTGANLSVLRSLGVGHIVGCDMSVEALHHSQGIPGAGLVRTDACRLPFKSGTFDALIAMDVIEHLDEDLTALREFARVLKPGGHLFATVPAFPSLWGPQDIVAHHRRRYRRRPLLALFERAGLRVATSFYFNYLLFLPIWLTRQVLLAMRVRVDSENEINTPWLNRLLTRIFLLDVRSAPHVNVPFGVSLCLVGRSGGEPVKGSALDIAAEPSPGEHSVFLARSARLVRYAVPQQAQYSRWVPHNGLNA
jgi:SAM-dependent methyltransferase